MSTVTAEIHIQAPIKFAYRAFTNSTALREWLCDVATVNPHPRGRMYLWWHGDFYSSGHYLELEENKRVVFQWHSNQDPEPTEVTITVTEKDGGTHLKLDHAVPDDGSWTMLATEFIKNWEDSLENLKSVLETGIDLRIANRPMLGILPGDFTEEQAKALKVPVRAGLRLDGVVDGMGAQKAGLQRDDVLVKMAGKPITGEFNSLLSAIEGKKGGDNVEIVFHRGPEKKTVTMELSKRPMPDVPFQPAELARKARAIYEPALAELEKCFEGCTDGQAMQRPAPTEWSALETVAHLIQGERINSIHLSSLIDGYELTNDGDGSNVTAQMEAIVKANPSIQLMLDTLRRAVEEILIYTELIPEDFVANKGSYHRFGSSLLQPNFHLTAHTQQIKDALATAAK
ncbi:MAG: SRPBCC domain-containing protein [Anaerolineales bacterium]|nr:MAG: SRPBCC domain-containing protein [Anaerolineales bacterium]